MRRVKNVASTFLAAVFAVGMMAVAAFAAWDFEGAWKVKVERRT